MPETKREITVAAGIILRDRQILIAKRKTGEHLGGYWEFPGGKKRESESLEACLRRELKEELDIEVKVDLLWKSITHEYEEAKIHLNFFTCHWISGIAKPLESDAIAWILPEELKNYKFPPADDELINELISNL